MRPVGEVLCSKKSDKVSPTKRKLSSTQISRQDRRRGGCSNKVVCIADSRLDNLFQRTHFRGAVNENARWHAHSVAAGCWRKILLLPSELVCKSGSIPYLARSSAVRTVTDSIAIFGGVKYWCEVLV
ncbi:unnamed protein product [Ectocarpus sp. 13 AM-2016]